MDPQQHRTPSAEISGPACPPIFGAKAQPGKTAAHRTGHIRSGTTAEAPTGDADAFFRTHPAALLEGLLNATIAEFGDPVPDPD
ncbi:MAG: hypothetical protein M0Z84_08710 [Gammaproteobacteria bacterium]|nr:hypothetical protein [Gammaproteobacteria bacterium]